jgi:tRNA A37 threonylcarbamoyladenosine biosynthesis protein TsaE
MSSELAEVLNDPEAVVVVEWANIVENILPDDRLSIKLIASGDTSRQIIISYPSSLAYLLSEEQ